MNALKRCAQSLNEIIIGKESVVEMALAALLAQGSILIEDRPGLGKTTLAKSLAKALGLSFQRIQCTNDLLPMDILGRMDFSDRAHPRLIEGPLFASVVILDELNRAPARTQSAFLQAMEEGQVSLEGVTKDLPKPQLLIATQNPAGHVGTAPLPESELDRFTVSLSLGTSAPELEKLILKGLPQLKLKELQPQLTGAELQELQQRTENISVSEVFYDLVVRFLDHARARNHFLSPRAGRDVVRIAKALALLRGRDYVVPEDFKSGIGAVAGHRTRGIDELVADFSFQL